MTTSTFSDRRPGPIAAADPLLAPVVFSTDGVEARHQRDHWVGTYDSFNRLEVLDGAAQGFAARNEVWSLGDVAVMRNLGPAVAFERTARHIRRDSLDHWVIRVTRSGRARHRVGDRCLDAPPHVPLIFSLGEPYCGERNEADWVSLYVPRDSFPELSSCLGRLGAGAIDTVGGRMLADYIFSLRQRLPEIRASEMTIIAEATRAMITACLLSVDRPAGAATPVGATAQFEIVRRIVRRNIASPTLGPAKICHLAGMSRSQLYRLFEPHGGVAHYVQRVRLRMVHAMLSDPSLAHQPIAATAEKVGLFDASAFSRAFRREFGYAPREARAMAIGGFLARSRSDEARKGSAQAQDFAGLLRQVGSFRDAGGAAPRTAMPIARRPSALTRPIAITDG